MPCCLLLSCAIPAMLPFHWPIVLRILISRQWLRFWRRRGARSDLGNPAMIIFWYFTHHALHVASSLLFWKHFAQSHDMNWPIDCQLFYAFKPCIRSSTCDDIIRCKRPLLVFFHHSHSAWTSINTSGISPPALYCLLYMRYFWWTIPLPFD